MYILHHNPRPQLEIAVSCGSQLYQGWCGYSQPATTAMVTATTRALCAAFMFQGLGRPLVRAFVTGVPSRGGPRTGRATTTAYLSGSSLTRCVHASCADWPLLASVLSRRLLYTTCVPFLVEESWWCRPLCACLILMADTRFEGGVLS